MPYRFLPENFENDYRSVWVDVPQSLYDGRKVHGLYHEYLDELEHAERSGFDGLCVNEHHQNAYGLMPSPNLMAAALSRRTSTALPPSSRIRMPAMEASGWAEATAPLVPMTAGRYAWR